MSEEQSRTLPENALDYNMMMIESVWGRAQVPPELASKLQKITGVYVDKENKIMVDENGNPETIKEDLWATLGFYTRDMRLSNLDNAKYNYCVHYTDLGADFLRVDQIEPFLICLSRVATVCELSQSKNGFLRNRQGTISYENKLTGDPAKRSLLTGKSIPEKTQ
jgi:hypothetical protein